MQRKWKMYAIVGLALLLCGAAATAMIFNMRSAYEQALQPLGLERAVRVNGTPCLMTTPYDTHARCGSALSRVNLAYCQYPAFINNELVCGQ